ncbi:MAG: DUF1580 domain-containing protein [Planctomycetes bacterium]|nr:DUF1580 domain-containing protein [Planctomycetota bacterium]
MNRTEGISDGRVDLTRETVITIAEAARRLPIRRGGKPLHVNTLHRWAHKGCRGVVLETVMIGGARCTTVEALRRFVEACSIGCSPIAPAVAVDRHPFLPFDRLATRDVLVDAGIADAAEVAEVEP